MDAIEEAMGLVRMVRDSEICPGDLLVAYDVLCQAVIHHKPYEGRMVQDIHQFYTEVVLIHTWLYPVVV